MRQLIYYVSVIIVFATFSISSIYAQNDLTKYRIPKKCHAPIIDFEIAKQVSAAVKSRHRSQMAPVTIRVFFRVFRNDNGTFAAATEQQVLEEFADLNEDFNDGNICFLNMGIDFVNNTSANNSVDPDNAADVQFLSTFAIANVITIFYHRNLGDYGGNAYSIPNTFCSIVDGNIGLWRTISHEVGHCLGLIHTFNTSTGEEYISGFQCGSRGDLICDTPADPYDDDANCYSAGTCLYTGNCTDPAGASNYSPPYTNIMSYWGSEGCTLTQLTSGQYNRALVTIALVPSIANTKAPNSIFLQNVIASNGRYLKGAAVSLNTSTNVNLTGSVLADLNGGVVSILPGFIAMPSSGFVHIHSGGCNF